ncbi:MAG: trypsin-like serine protease [Proteobacteria bacterium]|nr:MAG: trypsin-like serine protease [Pseudomonadota bacterium]
MVNSSKKALKLLAPLFLATAVTTACGTGSHETSSSKVTNGVAVTGNTYPSTVLLISVTAEGEGICTGTFVNDSQVVSAGHCVEGLSKTSPNLVVATEKNGQIVPLARATSWVRNPNYSIAQGVSPYDVSVINFPANTAPAVTPIAAAAPATGEVFTIVGYGNNQNFMDASGTLNGDGAGTKRAGSNRISEVSGGMISFTGLTGTNDIEGMAAGQYVASGSGDSGGPMFVKGKLVGVTSGGGIANTPDGVELAISFYVDLNSSISKQFLSTVLKKSVVR